MTNTYPEPVWGIPQEAMEACSAFQTSGPTPFMLSGAFLRLLQYHFSDPDNIEEELLKGYIWTPSSGGCLPGTVQNTDGTVTTVPGSRVLILPSYSAQGQAPQQLPGIYVKREPFKTERISFRDQTTSSLNAKGVMEGMHHNANIVGSHSIICKGMTGGESELLGQEVFFRMLHYQQIIKKDFTLGHLMTQGVSEVKQRTDEARSTFYTVVSLEWAYVYRWLVIPESPVVKRIMLRYEVS